MWILSFLRKTFRKDSLIMSPVTCLKAFAQWNWLSVKPDSTLERMSCKVFKCFNYWNIGKINLEVILINFCCSFWSQTSLIWAKKCIVKYLRFVWRYQKNIVINYFDCLKSCFCSVPLWLFIIPKIFYITKPFWRMIEWRKKLE